MLKFFIVIFQKNLLHLLDSVVNPGDFECYT